jgi:hypothetical protein
MEERESGCCVAKPDEVELQCDDNFYREMEERERERFNTYSYPELSQSSHTHEICFHK